MEQIAREMIMTNIFDYMISISLQLVYVYLVKRTLKKIKYEEKYDL